MEAEKLKIKSQVELLTRAALCYQDGVSNVISSKGDILPSQGRMKDPYRRISHSIY
jgi:hypothetical protein